MHSVLDVDGESWEQEILKHNTLVVVDFWHAQCVWCIRLAPVFAEVAAEYKDRLKFAKLNVFGKEANREIAVKYGIMSTPSMVFFCEGRPLGGVAGFQTKEQLKELIDSMIEKHPQCMKQSTQL